MAYLDDERESVLVWTREGRLRAELAGGQDGASDVAAHPARDLLMTEHWNHWMRLWSPDGVPLGAIETNELIFGVLTAAPNGSMVAGEGIGADVLLRTHEPVTESRLSGHGMLPTDLAFSPDGSWLASVSGDGTVRLWDADGGLALPDEHLRRGSITSLTITGDGGVLVTAGPDGGLTFRDAEGSALRTVHDDEQFDAVAMSADGSALAAADGDGLLWLLERDGRIRRQVRLSRPGTALAIAPDGSWAAVATDEKLEFRNADGELRADVPIAGVEYLSMAADGGWAQRYARGRRSPGWPSHRTATGWLLPPGAAPSCGGTATANSWPSSSRTRRPPI
ncbi:WD40 repeat domain-containing protein [Nonomuraea sp. NPDC049152]|uniref:WD40 repeat domain-containing protein n=1 Tax=Nonomuraea sp. NPDC049152 TaxID=3154350 RepID=UPI0033F430A3